MIIVRYDNDENNGNNKKKKHLSAQNEPHVPWFWRFPDTKKEKIIRSADREHFPESGNRFFPKNKSSGLPSTNIKIRSVLPFECVVCVWYTHARARAHTHTHTHVWWTNSDVIHMYEYTHIHAYIYTHTCIHIHTCIHKCISNISTCITINDPHLRTNVLRRAINDSHLRTYVLRPH